MAALGGDMAFAKRYFVDFSYRYGRVLQKTEDSDVVIAGFNTHRVQIGLGVKF
jgi:opacity protein-like surface antigen